MSGPFGFFGNYVIPTWLEEIEISDWDRTRMPAKICFFGFHLNLGAKFQTKIGSWSLTKLRKNNSPPRNLRNQQKTDAYVHKFAVFLKVWLVPIVFIIPRKCINHPNCLCFVLKNSQALKSLLWKVHKQKQQRNISHDIKNMYAAYFGCPLGD